MAGVGKMTIASLKNKVEQCVLYQTKSQTSQMKLQKAEWKYYNYEESYQRLLLGS